MFVVAQKVARIHACIADGTFKKQYSVTVDYIVLRGLLGGKKRKFGGTRYEARSCERSFPDTLAFFEPAKLGLQ